MALKSQPRPHPIGPLGLGADGVHVLLLSELEALHCLLVSQLQVSRHKAAFPLILGKALLGKEMPLQSLLIVGAFWFRLLSCESSRDFSLPSDIPTNRITPNGDISHCAHPSDKEMEIQRGSDLLRLIPAVVVLQINPGLRWQSRVCVSSHSASVEDQSLPSLPG